MLEKIFFSAAMLWCLYVMLYAFAVIINGG